MRLFISVEQLDLCTWFVLTTEFVWMYKREIRIPTKAIH